MSTVVSETLLPFLVLECLLWQNPYFLETLEMCWWSAELSSDHICFQQENPRGDIQLKEGA